MCGSTAIRDMQNQMLAAFADAVIANLKRSKGWFDLAGKMLADEHVPRVVAAMRELRPTSLHIQSNPRITAAGYGQLFEHLANNDTLKVLHVGVGAPPGDRHGRPKLGTRNSDMEHLRAILHALAMPTSGSRRVLLNRMMDVPESELLEARAKVRDRTLELGDGTVLSIGANFDAAVAAQLVAALKTQKGLEQLSCVCTYVRTWFGCGAWSPAARLSLSDTAGSAWHVELATVIATHPTLKQVDLEGTGMTDEGASVLARALEINSVLEVLRVRHNKMTDDGAVALAQALRQNVALKWLDVAQNKLTPACKDALEAYKRTYLSGIKLTVFVDKDEAEDERGHEEWKGKTLDNLQKGLELKIRLLGCDSLEVAKAYADIGMQLHKVIFLLRLLHLFLLILSECKSACRCMSLHVFARMCSDIECVVL